MSADQFLDIAEGHTLYFHDVPTGRLIGVEQFLSRQFSVWKRNGETCTYGHITIEDGLLCFKYEDEPSDRKHCWYVFHDGDRILVRTPELFRSVVQEVRKITKDDLGCPNAPTS